VLGRPYAELQRSQQAVALPGVGRVAQLDVSQDYACARDDVGAVRCWGSNQYGQLGRAELEVHPEPVLIAGLPPAIDITAGGQGHACAIADDGGIYCWGYAQGGRLGIGTNVDISAAPDAVAGIESAVHVATTITRSCAIVGRDRRIRCWGNPDNRPRMVEIAVPGARDVALAMEGCAIDAAGKVLCWDPRNDTPRSMVGPVDAQELRADTFMHCARTGSGEVWCWGAPTKSGVVERFAPVRVAGLGRASRIAIDGTMGCAIVEGGAVTC
jgi:alpha-tubulin suppressor-like RCC1 family protein